MNTEIAKNSTGGLPTTYEGGGGEEILSSSIVIPRLLLMQGLSEFVNERKAQQGDMVKSTPFTKLGDPEVPVEIIPITFNNQWMKTEQVGKKWEFRGYEPLTAKNQDLPWEFEQNGTQWRRAKVLNLYALLPKDVAAEREEIKKAEKGGEPDATKALLPVMISFRITSYPAGKDVMTYFAKAQKFRMPGYARTLKLSSVPDKNDQGSFFVFKVETLGSVSKEDQEVAAYWYNVLRTRKVEVDADEEEKTSEATTQQNMARPEADAKF